MVGGRIDRLLVRRFATAYATISLLTLMVAALLEVAANAAEASTHEGVSLGLVIAHACSNLPVIYYLTAPLCALLAGQWTVVTLLRRQEYLAVHSAGISARRALAPLLFVTLGLTATTTVLRDPLLEYVGRQRDALDLRLLAADDSGALRDVWLRDRASNAVHIDTFHMATEARPASIEGLDADRFEADRWIHFHARCAEYVDGAWRLTDGTRIERARNTTQSVELDRLEGIEFTPEDVGMAFEGERSPLALTSAQVAQLRERNPHDTRWITLTEVHRASPWSAVALLLTGCALLVSAGAQRLARGMGQGLLVALGYIFCDLSVRLLGLNGQIPPTWSGWLPLLAFGSFGIATYLTLDH